MNKIRMIAFDLDGTLLDSEKQITEYTKEVLKQAAGRGIEIVPSTGRPFKGVPKDVLNLPGVRYAVTSNGARMIEVKSGETVDSMLLSFENAKEILDIFREYDTIRDVFYDGRGYTERKKTVHIERYMVKPVMAEYFRASRIAVDDIDELFLKENRAVDKVHALFADLGERQEAFERLRNLPAAEPSSSVKNNIEVNAAGVHKGIGLKRLGDMLGIRTDEILAFGDGLNDIRMLRTAGIGVAMENASQEVKEAADDTAFSNDRDGVAKYIEKHVLS